MYAAAQLRTLRHAVVVKEDVRRRRVPLRLVYACCRRFLLAVDDAAVRRSSFGSLAAFIDSTACGVRTVPPSASVNITFPLVSTRLGGAVAAHLDRRLIGRGGLALGAYAACVKTQRLVSRFSTPCAAVSRTARP